MSKVKFSSDTITHFYEDGEHVDIYVNKIRKLAEMAGLMEKRASQ